MNFKTIEWKNNKVVFLDQRALPHEEIYLTCSTVDEVAEAIKTMAVRGAPAIGVAAAMGVALGALAITTNDFLEFEIELEKVCEKIRVTRPTAVNLFWGVEQIKFFFKQSKNDHSLSIFQLKQGFIDHAQKILQNDILINRRLGEHGSVLVESGDRWLTHCNAGALATAGHGTALGVMYSAWHNGKRFEMFVDETRPLLQGARLTFWELCKNNIPATLITDSMAGWMMKQKKVNKVIVGADRIAANGDVANKIGTYSLALLAKMHQIPFYVAAPLSTIDFKTPTGEDIIIEQRDPTEITKILNFSKDFSSTQVVHMPSAGAAGGENPAFDVTPAEYITGIITEVGIVNSHQLFSLQAKKSDF